MALSHDVIKIAADEHRPYFRFHASFPSVTLVREGGATVVCQKMEYELKFGPLGKLLDAVMVRRKWNAGINAFLSGLKRYAETEQASVHAA